MRGLAVWSEKTPPPGTVGTIGLTVTTGGDVGFEDTDTVGMIAGPIDEPPELGAGGSVITDSALRISLGGGRFVTTSARRVRIRAVVVSRSPSIMVRAYHGCMAHNRRKQRLEDVFEPERREEMMAAFLEYTSDDLGYWFVEPWRDGRNAARLCLTVIPPAQYKTSPEDTVARAWLFDVLAKDHSALTSEDYERANEFRYEVSRASGARYGSFTDAALTIYANWIARSDGGGYVPNVHLETTFARAIWNGELDERIAHEEVGHWRARDAGIAWQLIGDGSDEGRLAATHRWFWMNRRCALANALARSHRGT